MKNCDCAFKKFCVGYKEGECYIMDKLKTGWFNSLKQYLKDQDAEIAALQSKVNNLLGKKNSDWVNQELTRKEYKPWMIRAILSANQVLSIKAQEEHDELAKISVNNDMLIGLLDKYKAKYGFINDPRDPDYEPICTECGKVYALDTGVCIPCLDSKLPECTGDGNCMGCKETVPCPFVKEISKTESKFDVEVID